MSAYSPLRTDLQTTDDFSFHIWQQIFRAIVRNETKAMEIGRTVHFEIEVNERSTHAPHEASILKVEMVCEPGQRPRLASDQDMRTPDQDRRTCDRAMRKRA